MLRRPRIHRGEAPSGGEGRPQPGTGPRCCHPSAGDRSLPSPSCGYCVRNRGVRSPCRTPDTAHAARRPGRGAPCGAGGRGDAAPWGPLTVLWSRTSVVALGLLVLSLRSGRSSTTHGCGRLCSPSVCRALVRVNARQCEPTPRTHPSPGPPRTGACGQRGADTRPASAAHSISTPSKGPRRRH